MSEMTPELVNAANEALQRWRQLPEDERNGERPFIMGFNNGWEAAAEQNIGRPDDAKWKIGDPVQKKARSQWRGRVVGYYRTVFTPIGYCVESAFEGGSVQIWPEEALEDWRP